MLTPIQRNVLNLIANDKIYTDRNGGNLNNRRYGAIAMNLAGLGYARLVEGVCCMRKYYLITQSGQDALARR